MNENNNKITSTLINLVSNFEGLIQKGQIGSYNKEEYTQLINFYIANNNIDKAMDIVDIAIEQYKYITNFYLLKGNLLLQLHQPEDALKYIEHCENLSPYDFEVRLLKAKSLSMTGDIDKSWAELNELKTFSNLNYVVEVNIIKSYIYEYTGEFEKMFDILKETLILDPMNIEALHKMNIATLFTRKYEESASFHLKLIEDSPYNYMAWFNLGQIYSIISQYEHAIDCLEYSFLINPGFEEGYLEYTDLCLQVGKYRNAAVVYEEYISKFEADSEIYLNLINAYIHLKDYKKAKKYAFKSIKLDSYNDEAYFMLGEIFKKQGKWEKALNAYQKAIEIEKEREEYYNAIAEMYIKLNDLILAEKYYDKLIELNSPEEKYYLNYILFLIENKKYKKADKILEISEDLVYCAYFNYLKAVIRFKTNNKKEALLLLDNALSENIDEYKKIFEIAPELKFDKEVNSMINYYKNQ
jgi:tetratricopeptide (TPR) repeat protein